MKADADDGDDVLQNPRERAQIQNHIFSSVWHKNRIDKTIVHFFPCLLLRECDLHTRWEMNACVGAGRWSEPREALGLTVMMSHNIVYGKSLVYCVA